MDAPVQLNAFVWESRPGQLSLTIACALAFRLQHGAEAHPIEPLRYYDEELASTFDANMRAPFKPRADILVAGQACADPRGPEVESLVVGVRYGEFSKNVRVTGDRVWVRDGGRLVASAPRPFRRLPLHVERASRSAENPRGFDPDAPAAERRVAMPNLERVAQSQSALLGAVPGDAPQRANLLRTGPNAHVAAGFVRAMVAGQRSSPPPEGFPFAFFNIAPLDQQLDHLPWGGAIVLENMHAERSLFSSRLPALMPRGFVFDPMTQSHLEVELRCDTLWIDADREAATLVCRGVIAAPSADAFAHASVRVDPFVREERSNAMFETRIGALDRGSGLPFGRSTGADAARAAAPTFGAPPVPAPRGDDPSVTTRMVSLTIGQQRVGPPPRAPAADSPSSPPPPDRKAFITQEIDLAGPVAATPFEAPHDAKLEDPPTRAVSTPSRASVHTFDEVEGESSTDTPTPPPRILDAPRAARIAEQPTAEVEIQTAAPIPPPRRRLRPPEIPPTPPPPLPPKPAVVAALDDVADAPAEPPSASERPAAIAPPARVLVPTGPARLGALKLGNAQLKGSGLGIGLRPHPAAATKTTEVPADRSEAGDGASAGTPGDEVRVTTEPPPVPAPAVIASLRDEHTETHAGISLKPVEARTLEEAEAEADRDAFEFPLPKSDGHEVEGVTLEHCAAIRAAMAMSGADRARVLASHDLDDATWARVEKAHMARIDQETSKGVMDLLSRYDAAYVAAQDRLRRPIGVKEYARILVAKERGDLADTMTELGVPRSELMRLDRVWKQRRSAYPDVDQAITLAVAAQKAGPQRK